MEHSVSVVLESGVAWIVIDQPGRKVNTLGRELLRELDEVIAAIEVRDDTRGLVLSSGKPGQFVAGADLKEILRLAEKEPGEIAELVGMGHRVFGRIAELPFPTIALIDGPCLGGGLELALACDARIVSSESRTLLGLPEVGIGLIPSWGGTQRLPRLIAPEAAARMVLEGEPVGCEAAVGLGLAEECCRGDELGERGKAWVERFGRARRWVAERMRKAGAVMGLPELPPAPRPEDPGQASAYDAAWCAMVEGGSRPLVEGLRIEEGTAVPLFLEPEAGHRIRAVLARRHARDSAEARG